MNLLARVTSRGAILPRAPRLSSRSISTVIDNETPSSDTTVRVMFVDFEGNRSLLPGRVGMSVLDVATLHKYPLYSGCDGGDGKEYLKMTDDYDDKQYMEGPQCNYCHVILSRDSMEKFSEPLYTESDLLDDIVDNGRTPASRLACQLTLTKEMDGLVVHVPDTLMPYSC